MAVRGGFPILVTEDLDALADFYEKAFDAERTYSFFGDNGETVYVSLAVGGASLGIGKETDVMDAGERISPWFTVDDADESYQRALDAGASSDNPPADMPWGERVARVRDPAGFVLNLGSEST
jgi:uncharacterized glyoxalase superfamily protein PhnB